MAIADGFLVVECDYILELLEAEIKRTGSAVDRADFYRSSELSPEKVWRWADRGSTSYEFAAIVGALGLVKCLAFQILLQPVNAHSMRELEHAERHLMQALHFNRRVRRLHLCKLSFTNACRFNVDIAWRDTYVDAVAQDNSAVEDVRYLFM